MTTAALYPRLGATIYAEDGSVVPADGITVTINNYYLRLLSSRDLLTWDPRPDPSGTPTPLPAVGQGVPTYATAAELRVARGAYSNSIAVTTGCLSEGDGGGGQWFWDPTDSVTTDNLGTVLGASSGRWKRLYNQPVQLKWFGVVGDGVSDDTTALQNWLNAIPDRGFGYAEKGTYKVTSSLFVKGNEQTLEAAQSPISASGFQLLWAGSTADDVYVVYVSGFATELNGWSVVAQNALYGGFHVGSLREKIGLVSSSFNSRCRFVNCSVVAGPATGNPVIKYGFGVATDQNSHGEGGGLNPGSQDFHYFENCLAINMEQWGWYLRGTGNVLHTTLTRCTISNQMGYPGMKYYAAAGKVDGHVYAYGGGVLVTNSADTIIDNIAFSYLETGFKRTGNAVPHDRITNIDAEYIKRLLYVSTPNTLSTMYVGGGRIPTPNITYESLGPEVISAADHYVIYNKGPSLSMTNVAITIAEATTGTVKVDNSIKLVEGTIVAIGCILPSNKPFECASGYQVVSWGNLGPDGTSGVYKNVLNGVYSVTSGGFAPVATHFDAVQSYEQVNLYVPDVASATASSTSVGGVNHYANNAGVVTISDANTSAVVSLPIAGEFNSSYTVQLVPVSYTGTLGTIPSDALVAFATSKTTTQFTATVKTAPGVGNSVTFRWEFKNDVNL